MSILQEYIRIRHYLGEKVFQGIERYLDLHPHLFLSDIYYNQKEYRKFERWYNNGEH